MNIGIGIPEILLIGALIFVLFGSKNMPHYIRVAARLTAKVRVYFEKVKREIDDVNAALDAQPYKERNDAVIEEKRSGIRKTLLSARNSMDSVERSEKSKIICSHLLDSRQYQNAGAVMMYLPADSEVETREAILEMIKAGKRVLLPYTIPQTKTLGIGEVRDLEKDLVIVADKAPEPRTELRENFFRSDLRLIVCTGIGFDRTGNRLDMLQGYYDDFLREMKWKVPIVGIAFECQVAREGLPRTYDDIFMDQIITEKGLLLPQSS